MTIVSYSWVVLHFCYLFSYPSLLELHYGGRLRKSQTAREWARETGLLIREAEHRLDMELFLDEYPWWKLGAPHWSIILYEMFLHATEQGQTEVERLIHQGCQGSMWRPYLEADQSAMELVGYWTSGTHGVPGLSQGDPGIYHSIYLLRRPPGLPPCGSQWRRKAICNILSTLKNQFHQQVYPAAAREARVPINECQSRRDSYEEAPWEIRVACQRALEVAKVLRSDIERLSWGMRDSPRTHSQSHSRSCSRSCSRSHPWSCSLDR